MKYACCVRVQPEYGRAFMSAHVWSDLSCQFRIIRDSSRLDESTWREPGWRFTASCKLSGKYTANYVAKSKRKVEFSHGRTNSFFARSIFPAATDIISWCMQNLSSIHRLSKKFETWQGFTMVYPCQHGAYVAHEGWFLARPWQFMNTQGVPGRPWELWKLIGIYFLHGF